MVRNFRECLCPMCGHPRMVSHCGGSGCQVVTPAIHAALKRFAREHGRNWRAELKKLWETACSRVADPEYRQGLQEARNRIGPRRLMKVKV